MATKPKVEPTASPARLARRAGAKAATPAPKTTAKRVLPPAQSPALAAAAKPAKAAARKVNTPAAPTPAPTSDTQPPAASLTPKERVFAVEYLVDLNGTQAYMRAFPRAGANTARNESARLLAKPAVAALVAEGMEQRRLRVQLEADEVVGIFADLATADARELMEVQRVCCRYCWGTGHRYQRTSAEMARAMLDHSAALKADASVGNFDPQGGTGYHIKHMPNPDCPECFGDGVERVVFKDTRTLSRQAARLFAGVKVTKDGFEIKTHDQAAAAVQLGRHLGLFTDNVNLKHKGKVAHTVDVVGELQAFLRGRDSKLPISTEGGDDA